MPKKPVAEHRPSSLLQFVVNFAIPIFILTRFSSESRLGPINAMLIALAFPIAFEIYNIIKRKKLSLLSAVAIGGILVTGLISLLGLSEGWLAVRRALPYFALALVLFISMLIKRPLIDLLLPHVIDTEKVNAATAKNRSTALVNQSIKRLGYIASIFLFLVSIASYALTRIVITANTNTSLFNTEYARLRILSLLYTALPLLLGITAMLMYLLLRIEKLTGLETEELLKKK